MKKLLEGKNIIVTGTTRGMGKQMLATFAEHGANIFAHARSKVQDHTSYCENLSTTYGVRVQPIYFDFGAEDEIKDAVKEIRGTKQPIDGLVNNAGVTYNALFQMTDMAELRKQFEINFFAPFLFTQYISKLMVRNQKGSIVNISSTAAQDGNSGKSAYGASKAALLTMTMCISEELAASGVRANVICPGIINTEMLGDMPEYVIDMQKDSTYLGTVGEKTDIANTAAFLLSDRSSYITGQVIRVDGGVYAYFKRRQEAKG